MVRFLSFNINEGDTLSYGEVIGYIDTSNLVLQKAEVQATLRSLHEKTTDPNHRLICVKKQLAVQQTQLAHLEKDQQRFQNLVEADAATQKQLMILTHRLKKQKDKLPLRNNKSIYITQTLQHRTEAY
jgi:HlyD family secretion protein